MCLLGAVQKLWNEMGGEFGVVGGVGFSFHQG